MKPKPRHPSLVDRTQRREFLKWIGLTAVAAPILGPRSTVLADPLARSRFEVRITDHGARTHRSERNTKAIQAALDACHAAGGGRVNVPPGRFRTGALLLKSNVHLHLEEGAILQGSDDWRDYPAFSDWSEGRKQWGDGEWSNALLTAIAASNLRIDGPGTIDGVDCTRPQGEEGFRGPHAVVPQALPRRANTRRHDPARRQLCPDVFRLPRHHRGWSQSAWRP
jgi:hypothetical protein